MKKRLLLGVLPALMVLSACNGAGLKVEEPQLYLETTEANEIFGEAEFAGELRAKRNIGEEEEEVDPFKKPVVGVQYKTMEGTGEDPDTYAIRYIAAVASLDVRAYWSRGLTTLENNPVKPLISGRETTKAYSSLLQYNKSTKKMESITPSDFAGEGYNYFVTYSMYNIPEAELNSYMIGYLTIGENKEEPDASKNVTSDAVVSQINSTGVCFTVDSSKEFFMGGQLNGVKDSVVLADGDTLDSENNNASFTYSFQANDYFCVFRHNPSANHNWKFEISSYSKLNDRDGFTDYSGQIRVLNNYDYAVLVSKNANNLYDYRTHVQNTGFYVRGAASGSWDDLDEIADYQFYTDPRNVGILINAHLSVGEFKIALGTAWNQDEWGYWGYRRAGWGSPDYHGGDTKNVIGDAADLFTEGSGSGIKNINCTKEGYYDIYICNNGYISIVEHSS